MLTHPIALNRDTHRGFRLRPAADFVYAARLHMAPLCATEFFAASREFPTVFARSDAGVTFPIAVLGLREGQNLYVDAQGRWLGRYVPASVRSYPFGFVEAADERLQVLVDRDFAGFGPDVEGVRLFDESGEPGPELADKIRFLQAHRNELEQTRVFVAELKRLDLLMERTIELSQDGRQVASLRGLWVVDEARLNPLPDADLLGLARLGYLKLITAHLLSIGNLGPLSGRLVPPA